MAQQTHVHAPDAPATHDMPPIEAAPADPDAQQTRDRAELDGYVTTLPAVRTETDGALIPRASGATGKVNTSWEVAKGDRDSVELALKSRDWPKLSAAKNRTIRIARAAWYTEEVPHPTTGEFHRLCKVILIGPDGAFACHSAQPARILAEIIAKRGPGPWEPPVEIQVGTSRGRNGFDCLVIATACPDELLGLA